MSTSRVFISCLFLAIPSLASAGMTNSPAVNTVSKALKLELGPLKFEGKSHSARFVIQPTFEEKVVTNSPDAGRIVVGPARPNEGDTNLPSPVVQVLKTDMIIRIGVIDVGLVASFRVEHSQGSYRYTQQEMGFLLADKASLEDFQKILKKSVEWSLTSETNEITNYQKNFGEIVRPNTQPISATFLVDGQGQPFCVLADEEGLNWKITPRAADYLLFMLDSLENAETIYKANLAEKVAAEQAEKRRKDGLFK